MNEHFCFTNWGFRRDLKWSLDLSRQQSKVNKDLNSHQIYPLQSSFNLEKSDFKMIKPIKDLQKQLKDKHRFESQLAWSLSWPINQIWDLISGSSIHPHTATRSSCCLWQSLSPTLPALHSLSHFQPSTRFHTHLLHPGGFYCVTLSQNTLKSASDALCQMDVQAQTMQTNITASSEHICMNFEIP